MEKSVDAVCMFSLVVALAMYMSRSLSKTMESGKVEAKYFVGLVLLAITLVSVVAYLAYQLTAPLFR